MKKYALLSILFCIIGIIGAFFVLLATKSVLLFLLCWVMIPIIIMNMEV